MMKPDVGTPGQAAEAKVVRVSRSASCIVEQLGIDRAVNPVLISAGELVRFIQGGQILHYRLCLGTS